MNGVILDQQSFDQNDLDLSPLQSVDVKWQHHDSTQNHEVGERIAGFEIVITNKVQLDESCLSSCEKLKLILVAATGTDNVDLEYCKRNQIKVYNVRHYSTPAVAQHTINLILNLMTSQHRYLADVGDGQWQQSNVFCLINHPIVEVSGKTLGIVGNGTLGKKVSEIAAALGMNIVICNRPGGSAVEGRVSFEEMLKISDVISLHCPLTSQTERLFSNDEFAQMKSTAIIINTARGAIIDSEALIRALEQNQIGGAGIDVLDTEPPGADHPLIRYSHPNLLVTPHNAWGSRESRQRLVNELGKNMVSWLQGNHQNLVC